MTLPCCGGSIPAVARSGPFSPWSVHEGLISDRKGLVLRLTFERDLWGLDPTHAVGVTGAGGVAFSPVRFLG